MTSLTLPLVLREYDLAPPIEAFPVPYSGKNNTILGIHTANGDFIWKRYSTVYDLASILYERRLLGFLTGKELSFSIPAPLPTRSGAILCREPEGLSVLTRWFPGTNLDPARLDHAELLGAALGELQAALQPCPVEERPGNALFARLFDFPPPHRDPRTLTSGQLGLPDSAANEELLRFWRIEVARLVEFVEGGYRLLPWQICHNDVAPANVLVEGDRVSAVLDFEFLTPAPRALDVAMGLRMTMRIWEQPEPWDVIPRFLAGYLRWMPFGKDEARALPQLIALRSAIPVLWWLGRLGEDSDRSVVLRGMEYLRNYERWRERYEQRFVAEVFSSLAKI